MVTVAHEPADERDLPLGNEHDAVAGRVRGPETANHDRDAAEIDLLVVGDGSCRAARS